MRTLPLLPLLALLATPALADTGYTCTGTDGAKLDMVTEYVGLTPVVADMEFLAGDKHWSYRFGGKGVVNVLTTTLHDGGGRLSIDFAHHSFRMLSLRLRFTHVGAVAGGIIEEVGGDGVWALSCAVTTVE
jgi:hypothetical protein